MTDFWHAIIHWTGCDYGAPYGHFVWYDFWSGIAGSFIVGLAAFAVGWYFRSQCHVRRCYRLGRHRVAGGTFKVCRKHHPDIPGNVTAKLVSDLHMEKK